MSASAGITWWQWLVHTNDVKQLWAAQPTYLISQAVYLVAGLLTLIHAFRKGGRWPYFWLGTVLHGLYADNFWHFVLPEYDNFWHSQTPIIFLGARTPLHIIFVYPAFIYHAAYAISRLNLPRYAEPFAVGLVTVLIDIPYDIVAVKFVHWTWHDTDPNIFDRHYWVPWNSYYFHATFAASFFFFFNASRRWLAPKVAQWESAGKSVEWKSVLIASLLGMPGGVLMFVPLYHPLHDVLGIHSEVTFFLLFSIFSVFVLHGLLSDREKSKSRLTTIDYVLILQLVIHYVIYWVFVVFFHPEREWSLGLHEPVGPCNEVATLTTPFGQTLLKRKYFCPDNYDEGYFSFHCVGGQKPANGLSWYVVCGTPFANRAEYITLLSTILIVAFGVFYGLYFKTQPSPSNKKFKTK
uniref:GMPiso00160 n=1 Tax=Galleria mellonella TaxID=7137 RepID=A0A3G1T1B0_GALME|nr:GMPiso00160 [Galleria mellonella]